MKYLPGSILKTLLYLLLLIVPVLLFITFFALGRTEIPLWNIGIRNVVTYARNFVLPALIMSYLISTLLVVALVDKMKVRSIVSLHLPPLIIAAVIGAGVIFTRSDAPFSLQQGSLRIGPAQFFREGVFMDAGSRKIQYARGKQQKSTIYLYETDSDTLSVITNVSVGKEGRNKLYVDNAKREVVIEARRSLEGGTVRIPYRDFPRYRSTTDLHIFRVYGSRIRAVQRAVNRRLASLGRMDQYLFMGSLLLTLLMISIPAVYAMNDRGWGFSGIVGIFIVLAVLPFFYALLFRVSGRLEPRLDAMGKYTYFVPAFIAGVCGILIDLIVVSRSRARR